MGPTDSLDAITSLGDPVRRRLYEFVAGREGDVSREDAATGAGVPRSVAAFHLDRLVEEGLLEATFRRLNGRGGPGAGRPAKLYRRPAAEVAVCLPARFYDLAADLLATAIGEAAAAGPAADVEATLAQVAFERGRETAAAASGPADAVLAAAGYEPRPDRDRNGFVLANCPFHRLVDRHAALVCAMNHAFLRGVLEGMNASTLEAVADPAPGRCCVRVAARKEH